MRPAKREIYLGKITCEPYVHKRVCPVYVTLEVNPITVVQFVDGKQVESHPYGNEFSVMGDIYNHIKTDCYICGQCDEELEQSNMLPEYRKTFNVILRLWRKYHLKKWDDIPVEDQQLIEKLILPNQ